MKNWELNNEWVMLHSCKVLEEDDIGRWGGALVYSHMILGFATITYADPALPDTEDQLWNDHLWGQGIVASDEYPDDNIVYYVMWTY